MIGVVSHALDRVCRIPKHEFACWDHSAADRVEDEWMIAFDLHTAVWSPPVASIESNRITKQKWDRLEWLPFHSYWSFCRLTSSSTNISFGNRWGDDACTTIARSLPVVIDGDNTWWCWGGLCECKADGWLNWLNSICHFMNYYPELQFQHRNRFRTFFSKWFPYFFNEHHDLLYMPEETWNKISLIDHKRGQLLLNAALLLVLRISWSLCGSTNG